MEEYNNNIVYVKNDIIELNDKRFIVHPVQVDDSLPRLSIRYNVSEYQIKLVNQLATNQIHHLAKIHIPTSANVLTAPDLEKKPKTESQALADEEYRRGWALD